MMAISSDLMSVLHPYHLTNVLLSLSFIVSKFTPTICNNVFPISKESACGEFSMWESEVLFFMLVVIMFRTRKSGSRSLLAYIATASVYAKACNVILWFTTDMVLGIVYVALALIQFLLLGEPVYGGPEKITYFQENTFEDELENSKHDNTIWIITFFTAWSPTCAKLAGIVSKLSNEYALDNLKFGKIDVGRYPNVGKKHHINTTALSVQLPTISVYKGGKEVLRRPCLDSKGKFQKFYFTEDNIRAAFDLNNVYAECKKALDCKKNKKEDGKKDL